MTVIQLNDSKDNFIRMGYMFCRISLLCSLLQLLRYFFEKNIDVCTWMYPLI